MNSVTINGRNLSSFGIILRRKTIGAAEPRIQEIEVPGMDSVIDVTDFVGVTYSNREIEFELLVPDNNLYSELRLMLEAYNGTVCEVSFDDEQNIVWSGRMFLTSYTKAGARLKWCIATMRMSAKPFPINAVTGEEVRNV